MVASTGGYGFLCTIADMVSNRRAGREFMAIEEGETPLEPAMYEESPKNIVVAISEQGRMLLFHVSEMKQMSKGRGVVIMGLEKGEKLLAVAVSDRPGLIVTGTSRGKDRQLTIEGEKLAHYAGHRARMGRVLPDKLKPAKLAMLSKPVPPADA